MFCDVLDLGEDDAETAPKGIRKAVPKDIMALFAGFPCTSPSIFQIDSSSDENLNCVENGDLATGSVLLEKHGASLRVVVLESVLVLAKKSKSGTSNLDVVLRLLWEKGWRAKVWHLQPRDVGTPASRPRV